jgi:small subunit ribosomal protein S16
VAVKIKLMRIGKIREPHYRIVVADARTKRNGRAIEEIGQYHPLPDPSVIQVDSVRVQYWLGVGAQPTEAVAAILRVTGDWQQFKGEPAPPAMKVAEPKADKRLVFEAAVKEGADEPSTAATTAKKRAAKPAKAPEKAPEKAAEKSPAKAAAKAAPEVAAETAAEPAPEAAAKTPAEKPEATAEATPDATAEATAEATPEATADAPAEATPEATADAPAEA